ncbi:cytochrome b5 domain-containing protein [Clostridium sp.]|jgi:predicted heme/steroid binding protein|uniref:cytochrome b5 domain-containing protein n=1 Tax=Clostridium sp. TaxID=1506 RepID=UPI003EEA4A92
MKNALPPILRDKIDEIKYWQKQAIYSIYPYRKLYFLAKVNKGTSELVTLLYNLPEDDVLKRQGKNFTLEELSKYNGSMGNPAYVAINGIVYDVTNNMCWAGGTHFGVYSGKDLTDVFKTAHNLDVELLKTLPVVGSLSNV